MKDFLLMFLVEWPLLGLHAGSSRNSCLSCFLFHLLFIHTFQLFLFSIIIVLAVCNSNALISILSPINLSHLVREVQRGLLFWWKR